MAKQMKDSGIEWIGKIPESWAVGRVKNAYTSHKTIVGSDSDKFQRLALTLGGVVKRSKDDSTGLQPEAFCGYQILKTGELVFKLIDLENIQTSRVGLSPYEGIVSPAYIVLEKRTGTNAEYGELFFLSMWQRGIFNRMGDDSVRSSLNASDLLNIPYIMPPYDEQQRIADYLNNQCTYIDSVIEQTNASITEYKKLKQAIITEAVTKGVRGERPMKCSGIEWAPEVPCNWAIIPSKFMFRNSDERKQDGDVMLTSSQKYGIISQNEYMERENSKIVLANKGLDDWKHVEPYDFIISLRSFQGGLEMSETTGCITWHYIVLKPCREIYSNYYKWLFKSEAYIKALQRTCNYIRDGQDLRYSNFVQVPLVVPELGEQEEIAKYLDKKCAEIDTLIAKKEALLENLEAYKKSVIYEYVTGKKVVPNSESAVIAVDPILLKALLYAKTHELLGKNCRGRIQIQKMLFLIESMNDLKIGSQYVRQKFGPLDVDLDKIESFMEQKRWLKTIQGSPTSYKKMDHYKEYRTEFSKYLAPYEAEIKRIIHFFENMNTSQAERFATLMAVWNDFILDGNANPSDEELIHEVITNWHPHKANYKYTTWQDTVNKMRANGIIPHGYGTHTILHQDNFLS